MTDWMPLIDALQQHGMDRDCFIAMHPGQVWKL
jgi:hypothetical protein